jgi:hypothetical protein
MQSEKTLTSNDTLKKSWVKPTLYTHDIEESLGGIYPASGEDRSYRPAAAPFS